MRWTPGDRSNVDDYRGRSGMGLGGGVFSRNGNLQITQSTLAGNNADAGGGAVCNLGDGAGKTASLTLGNNILADTTVPGASDFAQSAINGGSVNGANRYVPLLNVRDNVGNNYGDAAVFIALPTAKPITG